MAVHSSIEWTQTTWNPVTGCTKVSPGCKNCYAERMARRLHAMGQRNYRNGFHVSLHREMLDLPLSLKKPQMIFVNSMSDLFHPKVPLRFVQHVFSVMNEASWHTFQILTKRSERLLTLDPDLQWGANIWMGVSVENGDYTFRIEHLRKTHARVKFISFEPLLWSVGHPSLEGIDWVIAGGESGPYARPVEEEWIVDIRDQCQEADVPFFFKQWGGKRKNTTGRLLAGRTWNEYPVLMK